MPEQPDWSELKNAFAELGDALQQTGHILTAQGAMGWMFRGDLDQARTSLAALPAEELRTVSVTAAALASLADEVLAGHETEPPGA